MQTQTNLTKIIGVLFPLYLLYVLLFEQLSNAYEPSLSYLPIILVEVIFAFFALISAIPVRLSVDGRSLIAVKEGGKRSRVLLLYATISSLILFGVMLLAGSLEMGRTLFILIMYNVSIELFTPRQDQFTKEAFAFARFRMLLLVLLWAFYYVLYTYLSFTLVSPWVFLLSGLVAYYSMLYLSKNFSIRRKNP